MIYRITAQLKKADGIPLDRGLIVYAKSDTAMTNEKAESEINNIIYNSESTGVSYDLIGYIEVTEEEYYRHFPRAKPQGK